MSKEKQNTPTNTPTQKQFTNCELKQIEEMARDIFAPKVAIDGIDIAFAAVHGADKPDSHFMRIAQHLYNAGYRKQSEGEWVAKSLTSTSTRGRTIKYSTYKCSVCGTWNGRHKQKYCHECGAKMKGGE